MPPKVSQGFFPFGVFSFVKTNFSGAAAGLAPAWCRIPGGPPGDPKGSTRASSRHVQRLRQHLNPGCRQKSAIPLATEAIWTISGLFWLSYPIRDFHKRESCEFCVRCFLAGIWCLRLRSPAEGCAHATRLRHVNLPLHRV